MSDHDFADVLAENPSRYVAWLTTQLAKAGRRERPHLLLMRLLVPAFLSNTTENQSVDKRSPTYRSAMASLLELSKEEGALPPSLTRVLDGLWKVSNKKRVGYRKRSLKLGALAGGEVCQVTERVANSDAGLALSNREYRSMLNIDDSLGEPSASLCLVRAFAQRIDRLKKEAGITHLAFVEKESGPVGALTMSTSLELAAGLPACTFREKYWTLNEEALAGHKPTPSDRIAIVYDLIITSGGVCHAADMIHQLTGATCSAVVVLNGYEEERTELTTGEGQVIQVDYLNWITNPTEDPAFRGAGGERRDVASRAMPRKDSIMRQPGDTRSIPPTPPGSYTSANRPPISDEAKRLLARVDEIVAERRAKTQNGSPPAANREVRMKLRPAPPGIRPTGSPLPGLPMGKGSDNGGGRGQKKCSPRKKRA